MLEKIGWGWGVVERKWFICVLGWFVVVREGVRGGWGRGMSDGEGVLSARERLLREKERMPNALYEPSMTPARDCSSQPATWFLP